MQQGPEVEMTVKSDRVHRRTRGFPGDSIESVVQCCHPQRMFLFQKLSEDAVITQWTDINVVRAE